MAFPMPPGGGPLFPPQSPGLAMPAGPGIGGIIGGQPMMPPPLMSPPSGGIIGGQSMIPPGLPMPGAPPPLDMLAPPPGMGMPPPPPMTPPPPPEPPAEPMSEEEQMADLTEIYTKFVEMQAEEERKPIYERWYNKSDYPRPKVQDVIELVTEDKQRHRALQVRIADDLDAIAMDVTGTFKNYDPRTESVWQDSSLAGEYELMKTMLGTLDVYYEAEARTEDDKDEAAAKEAALYFWLAQAALKHNEQGNADLAMDKSDSLLSTGRLCWRVLVNNDAESHESPFTESLMNPAHCFPTFDGNRGLLTMTCAYAMKVSEVIGVFDDGDGKVRNRLTKGEGGKTLRKLADGVEVMEYWNRRWYGIVVDGAFIHGPIEHKLGIVPFVYQVVAKGRSGFLRNPQNLRGSINGVDGYFEDVSDSTVYSPDEELARQGNSFIHQLKRTHFQREALMGRLFTEAGKAINQALLIEQDDFAFREGPPKISSAEGARNVILMDHEKVMPFPTAPNQQILAPLLGIASDAYARWVMPSEAHGMSQGTQRSGSAIESLSDAGREKMAPYLKAGTQFETRCAQMRLRLFRDWGWHIGTDGSRGEFLIPMPRASRGKSRYITLTHGMLRRTDLLVTVRMTSLKLQNMGPLANALAIRKTNGWITDEEALRFFDVRDPQAELRRITVERAKQNDEDLQRAIVERALQEEGDEELLAIYKKKNAMAAFKPVPGASAPPTNDSPSPPSPPGMGGSIPPQIGIQGMSLPPMGIPTGINGGRPPGSIPPPIGL